jgi:hypothetical protein
MGKSFAAKPAGGTPALPGRCGRSNFRLFSGKPFGGHPAGWVCQRHNPEDFNCSGFEEINGTKCASESSMLAYSALFAYGDPTKCINFFLDPDKPLSVKIIIISGAAGASLFFRWYNRRNPN